jgi:hypothetical protein
MDILFVGLSCDEHSCMKHIPTCLALKSYVVIVIVVEHNHIKRF